MSSAPSNTEQQAGEEAGGPAHRYSARLAGDIEARWQQYWSSHQTFLTPNPGMPGWDGNRPKFYCLDMFPYPSSAGLHVGHPEGYTATDIICRYKRMRGHNVLHPMGWDAFGLPAEQYAIKTGVHPAKTTRESIDNFRRQLQRFGFSYDWSREFGTIDEGYYKWTQWIFLRLYNAWFDVSLNKARPIDELVGMFERGERAARFNQDAAELDNHTRGRDLKSWKELDEPTRHAVIASYRLAYIGEQTVNWCPALGTALANEEVIDGRSERGSHPVVRKPLRQWMLRITSYAERLLDGLAGVEWPDSTKTQQTEWIGRSVGAHIDFEAGKRRIRVFTTRPDTVFGATYMVLAPEHPMVDELLADKYGDTVPSAWIGGGFDGAEALVERGASPREMVDAYRAHAAGRSDLERQSESKTKSGVFIGAYALNPASGERVPIFIADYVLMGYGTGAIMAVPAHDQRDFEFAQVFELPIRDVAYPRLYQAMGFYAKRMTGDERADDERWRGVLADFLGITTSKDAEPESFDALLAQVRKPRGEQGDAPEWRREFIVGAQLDAVGGTGLKRGSVKITWIDAIEGLGFKDADDFATTFEGGGLYAKLGEAMPGVGRMVNSSAEGVSLDGLSVEDAKVRIVEHLESVGLGEAKVNYRLRDWLFSRQRYWGEPFPIVYDEQGLHRAVSEDALPVTLPDLADYTPEVSDDPKPLLAKATEWINTRAGVAGVEGLASDAPVTRESNTMPGWAGSCWYYLRYCDPHNDERLVGEEAERAWMGENGVDLYIGGAEHAVLHLLYARFWHMVLYDLGDVSSPEPFRKLFHQGLITSYAYQRADKTLVPVDEVEEREDGRFIETATGGVCTQTTAKMSKTLKNVVNPDDVIAEFGADAFRLYEMYLGPLEQSKPWSTRDMVGMLRFLQRAWRLVVNEESGEGTFLDEANADTEKALHRTIAKVGGDIERLAFNTGISAMIEFVNGATSAKPSGLTRDQASRFALILCPFAPHIAEELWGIAGNAPSCSLHPWPTYDESMLTDDEVEIAVQIMGKTRAKLMVPADANAKAIEEMAMSDDAVKALVDGKTVRKVIVVPGRLINIVAN